MGPPWGIDPTTKLHLAPICCVRRKLIEIWLVFIDNDGLF